MLISSLVWKPSEGCPKAFVVWVQVLLDVPPTAQTPSQTQKSSLQVAEFKPLWWFLQVLAEVRELCPSTLIGPCENLQVEQPEQAF